MSKYMMNTKFNETSNVAVLSVKQYDCYNEIHDAVCVIRERFLLAAGMLKKEQFLGLQIEMGKDGKSQACAFSSTDANVTAEDLRWMFEKYADVGPFCTEPYMIRHSDSDKIYEVRRIPDNSGIKMPNFSEAHSRDYFLQLLDEMAKNNAAIQIIVGVTDDGTQAGSIFMILPDEMSLRMRTMVSFAFPNTKVSRLAESGAAPAGDGITMEYLYDGMTVVLTNLMGEFDLVVPEEDLCDDEEDFYELDDDEDFYGFDRDSANSADTSGFTVIEDLELSVRAYNCLKRAGIKYIEELQCLSDEDYSHIRNLGKKSIQEIKQKLSEFETQAAASQNYTEMLNELVGLKEVKEQVRKITAFAKMKKDMEELGMPEAPTTFNMEFAGNPGTAKTTVARILAGIFHEIGLLGSNEVVEVGRADLVARYVGQTANQVKSVFRQAKGKLLFIDEAYSLVDDREKSFGDEAINTIVQEMENKRKDTVVIFAGYPDKMKEFFSRNPGLSSRVPFHICFPDYSAEEMVQIVELEVRKKGFSLGDNARERISSICGKALRYPDAGNGRFCRNLVENAILGYASRVYGTDDEGSADKDFLLQEGDFVFPENMQEMKDSVPIGFRVA